MGTLRIHPRFELEVTPSDRRSGFCAPRLRAGPFNQLAVIAATVFASFVSFCWNAAGSPAEVSVEPGNPLQSIVAKYPPGTRFRLQRGLYRMQSVSPKDGDAFVGESGAILSGAQLLSNFGQEGSYWVAQVQVQPQGNPRGRCTEDHPACTLPEDLFIDDEPQKRAASQSDIGNGEWFLDYASGKAYLSSDPQGHRVEISVLPRAFAGSASNVRIEGLTIEKYASVAGSGAIDVRGSHSGDRPAWIIQDCEVRFNHGAGIHLADGIQVLRNNIHHNGQLGIAGTGSGGLIEGNEIDFNNYAGYSYGWEAGGVKSTFSKNIVLRGNQVHDNNGPGLWGDIENRGALYEQNHTRNNKVAGILHEISYEATIRSNDIENDGYAAEGKTSPWYGGGILIVGSTGVEVYGNRVTNCMNGIVGTQPDRKSDRTGERFFLRDLYVHDNVINQGQGVAAGIIKSPALDDAIFASWNNRFVNNTFNLSSPASREFAWKNALWMLSDWKNRFQQH